MVPRCILANPPRGGRCHWRDTLKLVKGRITKWNEGGHFDLWSVVERENDCLLQHLQKIRSRPLSVEALQRAGLAKQLRMVSTGRPCSLFHQLGLPLPQLMSWTQCFQNTLKWILCPPSWFPLLLLQSVCQPTKLQRPYALSPMVLPLASHVSGPLISRRLSSVPLLTAPVLLCRVYPGLLISSALGLLPLPSSHTFVVPLS